MGSAARLRAVAGGVETGGRTLGSGKEPARHIAGPRGQNVCARSSLFSSGLRLHYRSVHKPPVPGGDEGIRTPGLCFAKAALSQLSYIPFQAISLWLMASGSGRSFAPRAAGASPIRLAGFGPALPGLLPLWAFQDSNLRPFPYQRNALTN